MPHCWAVMPRGQQPASAEEVCARLHQVVSNMVDFGMDPQTALDAPRWQLEGVDSCIGPSCVEESRCAQPPRTLLCPSTPLHTARQHLPALITRAVSAGAAAQAAPRGGVHRRLLHWGALLLKAAASAAAALGRAAGACPCLNAVQGPAGGRLRRGGPGRAAAQGAPHNAQHQRGQAGHVWQGPGHPQAGGLWCAHRRLRPPRRRAVPGLVTWGRPRPH